MNEIPMEGTRVATHVDDKHLAHLDGLKGTVIGEHELTSDSNNQAIVELDEPIFIYGGLERKVYLFPNEMEEL